MLAWPGLCLGFATVPAFKNAQFMYRWTVPENYTDNAGLGGGLAYVVEPDFCAKMRWRFAECTRSHGCYAHCDDVQAAMLRSFATWSANHQSIRFVNVTDECLSEDWQVSACMQNHTATCKEVYPWSDSEQTACIRERGNCTKLCGAAEIFVLANENVTDSVDKIASVGLFGSLGFGNKGGYPPTQTGPRLPSGDIATRDGIIEKATITFHNPAECLYLDSYFCPNLQRTEARGYSVMLIFAILTMSIWTLALIILVGRFVLSLRAVLKHKRGWILAVRDGIHSLFEPISEIWLIFFLVVTCPWCYFDMARPCITCYNFEAAFTHEVGLALGLAQPNVPEHADSMMIKPLNSSTCPSAELLPWEGGALSRYVTKLDTHDAATEGGVSSELFGRVMDYLETKKAQPCPTLDDVQGLNLLYPLCSLEKVSDPACIQSGTTVGLQRLAMGVGVSLLVTFFIVIMCSKGSKLIERVQLEIIRVKNETEAAMEAAAVRIQTMQRGKLTRRMDIQEHATKAKEEREKAVFGLTTPPATPTAPAETEKKQTGKVDRI